MKSFLFGGLISIALSAALFWLFFQWYVPENFISKDESRLIADRNNMLLMEIDSLREDYDRMRLELAEAPVVQETQDVTEQWIQRRLEVHRDLKVRRVEQLSYEYFSMPVGEAILPEAERQAILNEIAMPSEQTVYLIVGITDELAYAPPLADLKQQGLAVKRARYVENLIENFYGERTDLFIDVLMDQPDRRGIMISRITFEVRQP
ncbi:hypothetical protein LGV61_07840 [Desulfurispirillum indicum]|uniref:Uncharacterized protein n=1 Tax=Desulfurispirillum indicum (strain ATCC BAA-1389 / DSM 22839 / S5) TaxID=653733 RepID=E6W7E1_DESIS|nr:hypothetical protein [Desulfurispirillum indicum]ADU66308.1 hypothetical protein Selin_1578 [Desulfurispirillum indicum S5]UCZ55642.1 hypothetical protein LGV61_07840 [Desulfurispirillum indicum]